MGDSEFEQSDDNMDLVGELKFDTLCISGVSLMLLLLSLKAKVENFLGLVDLDLDFDNWRCCVSYMTSSTDFCLLCKLIIDGFVKKLGLLVLSSRFEEDLLLINVGPFPFSNLNLSLLKPEGFVLFGPS